jgi:hypothetical protein
MHGAEAGRGGVGCESWPAAVGVAEVGVDDGFGGAKSVETRTFVVLQLEQLQQLGVLLRGGHEMKTPVRVGEDQTHNAGAGEFGGA